MHLLIASACSVKGHEKVEKMSRGWMYIVSLNSIIRDMGLCKTIPVSLRK